MNSTQNNNDSNPLSVEEISNLHGEELKKVLAQRLQEHKDTVAEIDASLKDICDEVNNMPDIDEEKVTNEDNESLAEIERQLDTDLNNAVLDLATEDEILKDVSEKDEEDAQ